jgi:hypothetical protein
VVLGDIKGERGERDRQDGRYTGEIDRDIERQTRDTERGQRGREL